MSYLLPRAISLLTAPETLAEECVQILDGRCESESPTVGLLVGDLAERTHALERHLSARGFQLWVGKVEELPSAPDINLLILFELPPVDAIPLCSDRADLLLVAPLRHLTDPGADAEYLLPWLDALAASDRSLLDPPADHHPAPLTQMGAMLFAPGQQLPGSEVSRLWLRLTYERSLSRRRERLALDQRDLLGSITGDLDRLLQVRAVAPSPTEDEATDDLHSLAGPTPAELLVVRLQRTRARFAPADSRRESALLMLLGWLRILDTGGVTALASHLRGEIRWRGRSLQDRLGLVAGSDVTRLSVEPVQRRRTLPAHSASVDIIICVHNAADDVARCLDSVLAHTHPPYRLILVDDGSEGETATLLRRYSKRISERIELLRNESATGYTRAANQGLRTSQADYALLLNSDTIVGPEWLDRLVACAESDARIGMVGPLSNTASWQSVPRVSLGDDWAENPLPAGESVESWSRAITTASTRLYPSMPFLNGFALLIRRQMIDEIGLFDEQSFGAGYGEENDYALRARSAGWTLALADDVYIHHAQSRSYSHERRKKLSDRAGRILEEKHGASRINDGVIFCREAPVLEGIRARVAHLADRRTILEKGRAFAGRRLLWVLPLDGPAGGGNVVVSETEAMQRMGVDVAIFNLSAKRPGFEAAYPGLSIPQRWGAPADLPSILPEYDGAIATWHESVAWLAPGAGQCRLGYYVQDFEALFYPAGSADEKAARASYRAISDLRTFTKTDWTRQTVLQETGVDCVVVGPSVDVDLFRPRGVELDGADGPLKVVAMVRPSSPRRAPRLTMEMLRRLSHRFGDRVEITIFGVATNDPGLAPLPQDFRWRLAGVLDRSRVATLLGDCQIFADFSTYQAMGLTALEAMACGAAVIVPARGGADSFARDGENALVVDTESVDACWDALSRLVVDADLRKRLSRRAIHDAAALFPERAALAILRTLFLDSGSNER